MPTFKIDVAMDIRAYGYVEVTAKNIDKAIEKATPEFIRDNFEMRGYGSEYYDYTNPRDIWLGDYECEDTGEEGFVERDLPNTLYPGGLAHDAAPEMLKALKDCAEILFHLGMSGKTARQDEEIEAVRERALTVIAKAEDQPKPSASLSSADSAASSTASTCGR
jgi:hypothetical protein